MSLLAGSTISAPAPALQRLAAQSRRGGLPCAALRGPQGCRRRRTLVASVVANQNAPEASKKEALLAELARLRAENEKLKQKAAGGVAQPAASAAPVGATTAAHGTPAPPAPAPPAPQRKVEIVTDHEGVLAAPASIAWPAAGETFWERAVPVDGLPRTAVRRDTRTISIVHVAAELAPVAKVGGLGDVVTGLARASIERGHSAEVYLPYYECIDEAKLTGISHVMDLTSDYGRQFDGKMQWVPLATKVYRTTVEGIPVYLFQPENNFFRGKAIYGGGYSSTEAYLYFSNVALEFMRRMGQQPDIIHVHDWHTSPIAMLFWDHYHGQGLAKPKLVLTVHNFAQIGECRLEEFYATGFDGAPYMFAERALDERTIGHNPERMCLLKGGIVFCNAITTVSPNYAREVMEGASGWLLSTLRMYKEKFSGIVNGIDTAIWDPARDPFVPAPFNAVSLANKALCKKFVQKGLGMRCTVDDGTRAPLVICITRLVPQKGVGMIEAAARWTKANGGQFVLLGTGGSDGPLRAMAGQMKDDPDLRFMFMFSDELSHYLFAAADMVLVPSIFEPCGLTQMLGQRYGAVPVVRRTGGLVDTVIDADAEPSAGTGFGFDGQGNAEMEGALQRAFRTYGDNAGWEALVQRCMRKDNSWDTSCAAYTQLYYNVIDSD